MASSSNPGDTQGLQLSIINSVADATYNHTFHLQLGLLNRTTLDWWLPLSNFGL